MTEADKKKLRSLADRLILQSRGMTGEPTAANIEMANEYAPLAEFTIKQLDSEKQSAGAS